ncbi:TPM domain-containing protein [bacterium]|nr:TPM domain-containing protein [bacterium]
MLKNLRFFYFSLIFLAILSFALNAYSYPVPKYTHYINDYANIIKPAQQQKLQSFMQSLDRQTGIEIAVLTMKTIEREPIDDFANETFNTWRVGKKGKDNGVLLVVVIDDKTARIEVGYGLEGVLPDGLCGEILDKMTVFFAKEEYSFGIYKGVTLIINEVIAQYGIKIDNFTNLARIETNRHKKGSLFFSLIRIIFFMIFFLLALSGRMGLFGFLMLGNMAGGGYWSGGSRGGFGDFGGFGGFGGGSSGGGGASRSW